MNGKLKDFSNINFKPKHKLHQ